MVNDEITPAHWLCCSPPFDVFTEWTRKWNKKLLLFFTSLKLTSKFAFALCLPTERVQEAFFFIPLIPDLDPFPLLYPFEPNYFADRIFAGGKSFILLIAEPWNQIHSFAPPLTSIRDRIRLLSKQEQEKSEMRRKIDTNYFFHKVQLDIIIRLQLQSPSVHDLSQARPFFLFSFYVWRANQALIGSN